MFRRVVMVLADGLRPDAVTPEIMPVLHMLGENFVRAESASTVQPPRTVAALTSLTTGVSPATHKLFEPGLKILAQTRHLRPLPSVLRAAGMRTSVVAGSLPLAARPVARTLAFAGGIDEIQFAGQHATDAADVALTAMRKLTRGLLFVYLPDCDHAGHEHGWMTAPYREQAEHVDKAIAAVAGSLEDDTLLIVLADHGGGGIDPRDHAQPHPLNEQIPLIMAGAKLRPAVKLSRPVSLLDVPVTILRALDVDVPGQYEGVALVEAFPRRNLAVA